MAVATWTIEVEVGGKVVAEVVARRPLDRMDFEPLRFVAAAQALVDRFVAVPDGAAAAFPSPAASAHPAALPLSAAE